MNNNDSIKINELVKIIESVKEQKEPDLAVSSDKVLRYLEQRGCATRNEIQRSLWRHVVREDLDVILTVLIQAGLIEEITTSHKIVYKAVLS
jgi:hypothetical protein